MDKKEIQEHYEGEESTWWFRKAVEYLLSLLPEKDKRIKELEVLLGEAQRIN